ncbi:MAG: antibiotic biosynthesis monooxygenase [Sandarakinorhabdus sp.]|nr:antibiotic biosynthesis monooxygenase [Sandarakinorhabdus sp.]
MAFSFLSRFLVKPEKEADFVALAPQLEEVSRREPWTLAYKFYRLEEPGMFAVYESFIDEAADIKHQQNPEGAALISLMVECIDGTYTRELLIDIDAGGKV